MTLRSRGEFELSRLSGFVCNVLGPQNLLDKLAMVQTYSIHSNNSVGAILDRQPSTYLRCGKGGKFISWRAGGDFNLPAS
jgi:hypothetical protein